MNLKRNFLLLLCSRGASMVALLVTGALINRALGPEGRGLFAEMQTWVAFFAVALGFSMDTAIYHFANRELYGEDDSNRFRTVSVISLVYGTIAATALIVYVLWAPERFSADMQRYLLILGMVVLTTMLATHFRVFIQALGDIAFSAWSMVAQGVVNILVIAAAYLMDTLDLRVVAFTLLVIQLVPLAMFLVYCSRKRLFAGRFCWALARGVMTAGLKQHIATVSTFVYTKINQLIVFNYCGESQAGIYAVALELAFVAIAFPATFQTVLYPRVIHAVDDYEITVRSLRYGIYGWGGCVLLIALLAKPLLLLYAGKEFASSVTTFRLLMVTAWLLPVSSMLAPYYVKRGAFYFASFSALVLGAVSVGLNLLLVPSLAAEGAAMATSISCFVGFLMILAFLGILSKKNPLVVFKPDFRRHVP